MTRRRLLVTLALLTATFAGTLACFAFREPFALRAYPRVGLGMTRGEVQAILGPASQVIPARSVLEYGPPLMISRVIHRSEAAVIAKDGRIETWYAGDFTITIVFDEGGQAVMTTLLERTIPPKTGWIERLRRWLGL